MINLLWPWMLLLLPMPLIVPHFLSPFKSEKMGAIRVPFFGFLKQVSETSIHWPQSILIQWLGFLLWILLVLAGSGPIQLGPPIPVDETARSVMLAVDLSGSMRVEDMREKRELFSRLDTVKRLASAFIEQRVGDRVGLILFGSEAYLRAPLTFDRQTVSEMLIESSAGIAGEQTAMGDAIALSLKRLKNIPGKDKVIILLTDGRNNAGHMTPDKAAEIAAKMKIKIYTIGLGRDDNEWVGPFGMRGRILGEGPDEETLKSIAKLTGGKYFRAQDPKSLQKIYDELDQLEPVKIQGKVLRSQKMLYPFFLAPALMISIILVMMGVKK